MEVEEAKARAQGLASEHGGKTWFFCSPGCKQAFDRDPKAAAARAQGVTEPLAEEHHAAMAPSKKAFHMEDPVCGMDVDPDEAHPPRAHEQLPGRALLLLLAGVQAGLRPATRAPPSPGCRASAPCPPPRARRCRTRAGTAECPADGGGDAADRADAAAACPGRCPREGARGCRRRCRSRCPPRRAAPADARPATPAGTTPMQVDPVCRMEVDPAKARAAGSPHRARRRDLVLLHPGSASRSFDADPAAYLPMVR